MHELRLPSASDTIYKNAGMWDSVKGLFGGGQQQQQPPVNLQQLSEQLKQAWMAFAKVYNTQRNLLNPAYQYISQMMAKMSNPETARFMQLTPDVMNKINSVIQQLNQAANEQNKDTQFLQGITQTIQGIAQYFGMAGPNANTGAPAAQAPAAPAGAAAPGAATPAPAPAAGAPAASPPAAAAPTGVPTKGKGQKRRTPLNQNIGTSSGADAVSEMPME